MKKVVLRATIHLLVASASDCGLYYTSSKLDLLQLGYLAPIKSEKIICSEF